ncbi:MAG TPA: AmmeMemoRadiSam system protein A [Humisphaera sp.]|nr:AmmeMemoRadiSam system protein A [Humisphaera sp.]
MELSAPQQQALMNLARDVIRRALSGQSTAVPPPADPLLQQRAGCFVSLHRSGTHRLRGCVGRIEATGPLWDTVAATSVNVLQDPRFGNDRITLEELPLLEIELSVLTPLQHAANPLDFDPKVHGLYLLCCGRTGCFLPQVGRETGWTREQLLARLCTEKMGLPPTFWMQAGAVLMTFTAMVIGPEPLDVPAGQMVAP